MEIYGYRVLRAYFTDQVQLHAANQDLHEVLSPCCERLVNECLTDLSPHIVCEKKTVNDHRLKQIVRPAGVANYFGTGTMGLIVLKKQKIYNGTPLHQGDLLLWNADTMNAAALFPVNDTEAAWCGLYVCFSRIIDPAPETPHEKTKLLMSELYKAARTGEKWKPDATGEELESAWFSSMGSTASFAPYLFYDSEEVNLGKIVGRCFENMRCLIELLFQIRRRDTLLKQLLYGYRKIAVPMKDMYGANMSPEMWATLEEMDMHCKGENEMELDDPEQHMYYSEDVHVGDNYIAKTYVQGESVFYAIK